MGNAICLTVVAFLVTLAICKTFWFEFGKISKDIFIGMMCMEMCPVGLVYLLIDELVKTNFVLFWLIVFCICYVINYFFVRICLNVAEKVGGKF